MLEIIIALLWMLGVNPNDSKSQIQVVNEATGECYGLGNTANIGNRPAPTEVYILMQDQDGNYYLVKR